MDPKEFQVRLAEVAVLKEVKLAREPLHGGYSKNKQEPLTEMVIDYTLPQTRPCEHCTNECSGQMNITYRQQSKLSTMRQLSISCGTCKKKIDPDTGKPIEVKPVGTNYVAQGLRVASPGKKLGRPSKLPWWNQGPPVVMNITSRETDE